MDRIFALDLKDDPKLIAGYEAWHSQGQVPAHVLAGIAAAGIREMRIFRKGNRLVMVTTIDETAPMRRCPLPIRRRRTGRR